MELDGTDKLFLGSLFIGYLSVMMYVAVYQPQDFLSCLTLSVIVAVVGFLGGWIIS